MPVTFSGLDGSQPLCIRIRDKTCNWNCVYCQLGRTQPLSTERRDYLDSEEILADVRAALSAHPPGSID